MHLYIFNRSQTSFVVVSHTHTHTHIHTYTSSVPRVSHTHTHIHAHIHTYTQTVSLSLTHVLAIKLYIMYHTLTHMPCYVVVYFGWLRSVGSIKLHVSFAEYRLFYRALLQKRPKILSILLTEATP